MSEEKFRLEDLACDLQEEILHFLPHSDVYKVIRCNRNMYDIGQNLYRNKFFQKGYHIMKLKKRKEGLQQLKEEYIKNCYNFIKEYGDVRTRFVRTLPAKIKFDPFDMDCLKDVKYKRIDSLNNKGVFSLHTGGFANAVQCFDGTAIVTMDHSLDFGFYDVQNENTNPVPKEHCVIQIECAANDIIYIHSPNKNESCGQVYSIKKTGENGLSAPILIPLPTQAKYVCGSLTHQFAVTIDNKLYAWMPHEECKPFLVKGLFYDDNKYDDQGNVILEDDKSKAKTEEDDLKKILNKPINEEEKKEEEKKAKLLNKDKSIVKLACGNTFILVLYKSGELFCSNFNEKNKLSIICKRVKEFIGKNIADIEAGFTHSIAFEKTIIPPINEWDSKQVSEWFEATGFQECCNLAKYHHIDGAAIANANTDYLEDVLGITDVAQQQKFRYEVNRKRETTFENINLYGWGSNTFGQLGVIDKALNQPRKIALPELTYKDDYILRFKCGRRNTAMLSKLGELWIMGNCKHDMNKKVNKELEAPSDEDNKDSEDVKLNKKEKKEARQQQAKAKQGKKNDKNNKKNKKYSVDNNEDEYFEKIEQEQETKDKFKKSRHNKQKLLQEQEKMREEKKKVYDHEKSIPHKWVNLTKLASHNDNGDDYKIDGVVIGVMDIAVVLSYRIDSLKYHQKKAKESKVKVRLQPIEKILIKIEKSQKYPIKDYSVIYLDRFQGALEADLEYFLESSDIPSHRIQSLLHKGEVIWDRKEKIDKFKFY